MKDCSVLPDFAPGEITIPPIPKFKYNKKLKDELSSGLTKEEAVKYLEIMQVIRAFEDSIVRMKDGTWTPKEGFNFIGASHLSLGQEAVAVGALSAINRFDHITSTHRGHGHGIAKAYYALMEMNKQELLDWIALSTENDNAVLEQLKDLSRDEIYDKAIDIHIYKTYAELFGKEEGYCRGRGGGMHIADFNVGHLGANAIVGGSFAIAVGAAMANEKLGNGKVCICFVGDGAVNNGIAGEALNFAAQSQFENGCPVVFLVENNQYGMTGQQSGEVTGIDFLAQRAAGFAKNNMHAEVVNGMDVLAVREALKRGVELCKKGEGPVFIECETYRYYGHSLSDLRDTYRTKEEESAWRDNDAIDCFVKQIVDAGIMTKEEADAFLELTTQRVRAKIGRAHV